MSSLAARLSPTPFWDLARDKSDWLIAGGRTYILGEELRGEAGSENIPQLCLSGKRYALEESESLDFLEERYLCQHSRHIKRLAKRGKRKPGATKMDGAAYWQHLAMLASDELARRYTAGKRTRVKPKAPELQADALAALLAGSMPASSARLKRPYALFDGRCIEFVRSSREKAAVRPTWLRCRGGWHIPSDAPPSRERLERRLKTSIARRITQGLEGILFSSAPEYKIKCNGRQLIQVGKTSEDGAHLKMGLEPFIIMAQGSCYAFPAAELCLELHRTKGGIATPATATVLSNYLHPFVYLSGRICHGPLNRFERLGIEFSRVYKQTEHDALAYAVATLFDEAAKVLHLGYQDGVNPVHRLTAEQFRQLRCSEDEAMRSGWKIYRQ